MYIKRLNKEFTILENNLIAHKGIYGKNILGRTIEPNSFKACKLAIDNNISFECDVRNTKDNVPVLAHDNYITTRDGKEVKISKYTYGELLRLTNNKITTLEEVLRYNNGKVGVIIDAKEAHFFYSKYRRNLFEVVNKYIQKGEIMLQSFNPFFMLSVRKHAKNIMTGQLICRAGTILDSFKAPKTIAYAYERIISLICFIARTDVIDMENHEENRWHIRTKFFISKKTSDKVANKFDELLERINDDLYKGRLKLRKFLDKVQLKLVKATRELTKKPVFAFTIEDESEMENMENQFIVNYIVDYSKLGVEKYIAKIKKGKPKE